MLKYQLGSAQFIWQIFDETNNGNCTEPYQKCPVGYQTGASQMPNNALIHQPDPGRMGAVLGRAGPGGFVNAIKLYCL